jgi:hypothetical protein
VSPLLTASELLEVQKVAEEGMTSPVTIYRRTAVPADSDEFDDELTYIEQATQVMGWVYSNPTPVAMIDSGALVTVNTYRLYLPVGTDIRPGDRVNVADREFTVTDTTAPSTWPALLNVSLRRRE